MTDQHSGGFSSGDDPVTRRLPLRGNQRGATTDDLWGSDDPDITRRAEAPRSDNPFAGTALGGIPGSDPAVNPFDKPPGSSFLDEDEDDGRKARTSVPVTLGLLCSIVAICAALTAALIPLALVLGAAGVVLSVMGLFTAHRRHVSGRALGVFALLVGLVAVGLAYGQHAGLSELSWLTPKLPNRIDDWLRANAPGL